jgi:hypothetical protein
LGKGESAVQINQNVFDVGIEGKLGPRIHLSVAMIIVLKVFKIACCASEAAGERNAATIRHRLSAAHPARSEFT